MLVVLLMVGMDGRVSIPANVTAVRRGFLLQDLAYTGASAAHDAHNALEQRGVTTGVCE